MCVQHAIMLIFIISDSGKRETLSSLIYITSNFTSIDDHTLLYALYHGCLSVVRMDCFLNVFLL
jgi:hypothetical protein